MNIFRTKNCPSDERTRRGFTLAETLVSVIVASAVGLMLVSAYKWMTDISARSSAWLLARSRGQRVLNFIEPRVMHCGLGLWACRSPGALRLALGAGRDDAPIPSLWDPSERSLRIYMYDPLRGLQPAQGGGVLRGDALAVMYGMPTGVFLGTQDGAPARVEPGGSIEMRILQGSASGGDFFSEGAFRDITSWCAVNGVGMPFFITRARWNGGTVTLSLANTAQSAAEIPPVSEISALRCGRFRVMNGSFCVQWMDEVWTPFAYYPREDGVLALWAEFRPAERLLDVWVLSHGSGGAAGDGGRPRTWPSDAPWEDGFARGDLCVSRASWKLENF